MEYDNTVCQFFFNIAEMGSHEAAIFLTVSAHLVGSGSSNLMILFNFGWLLWDMVLVVGSHTFTKKDIIIYTNMRQTWINFHTTH